MERALVAAAVIVAALVIAYVVERRRPAAPAQDERYSVPVQLDRNDFRRPEVPWLLVAFTSRTCDSCEEAMRKAVVVEAGDVVVQEVAWQDDKPLHERYGIDTVPALLLADAEGVVRASFVGAPTATDLWAAVAEARAPGSSPEPHLGRHDESKGDV